MSLPFLSVCMITYNHEKYISEAIDGVLMQLTKFNVELVICDDNSTDKNNEIIVEKIKDSKNLVVNYISHSENKGMMSNFIFALQQCKGKYIALCEGDDYWTDPLKLQKQVDFMEGNPEFSICFNRANILKEDGIFSLHPIPETSKTGEFKYADLLEHYNFITTASVLFRKPEGFKLPEWFSNVSFGDLALYKLVLKTGSIKCLDEVMSVYRIHEEGIYSKLTALKKSKQYLSFYSIIYPSLNTNEQDIVKKKRSKKIKILAKLKFSKSKWLRLGFKKYIEQKYSLSR